MEEIERGFGFSFLHVALNTENAIIHYCGPVNYKGRVILLNHATTVMWPN